LLGSDQAVYEFATVGCPEALRRRTPRVGAGHEAAQFSGFGQDLGHAFVDALAICIHNDVRIERLLVGVRHAGEVGYLASQGLGIHSLDITAHELVQ